MKALTPWALGALLLPLTAAAGRAADAGTSASKIESWRESAERPENFQRLADGSTLRHGAPEDPGLAAAVDASRATGRAPRLQPTHENFRRHRDEIPLPESFGVPAAADSTADRDYRLIGAGLIAVGGCLLLAWNAGREAAVLKPPPVEILSPTAFKPPPAVARCTAPAAAPVATVTPPTLEAGREEPFVDTRLPARTWRAIGWREQALIERWDSSREKALGRTSFNEWLDRQGPVAGVDTALLMAKLDRDLA